MDKKQLEKILEKNKIVSRFLGVCSLDGLLKIFNINPEEAKISLRKLAIGCLYATQKGISPCVDEKMRKEIWTEESNKYFKKGQKIDLIDEPIIVMQSNNRRYIITGHTHAKHIYNTKGRGGLIQAIEINHPIIDKYIEQVENRLGRLNRVSEL